MRRFAFCCDVQLPTVPKASPITHSNLMRPCQPGKADVRSLSSPQSLTATRRTFLKGGASRLGQKWPQGSACPARDTHAPPKIAENNDTFRIRWFKSFNPEPGTDANSG